MGYNLDYGYYKSNHCFGANNLFALYETSRRQPTQARGNRKCLGVKLENAVFKNGECVVSEVPRVVCNYDDLRWNVFHNFDPEKMLSTVQNYVFPFIKQIGDGRNTAFSRYMKKAVFLIPTPDVLVAVVDKIDSMDLNNLMNIIKEQKCFV